MAFLEGRDQQVFCSFHDEDLCGALTKTQVHLQSVIRSVLSEMLPEIQDLDRAKLKVLF